MANSGDNQEISQILGIINNWQVKKATQDW